MTLVSPALNKRPSGSPALTLPQICDLGHMMLSMPGVEGQGFLQRHTAKFRMSEGALPIV
jgi:hypothetical protein